MAPAEQDRADRVVMAGAGGAGHLDVFQDGAPVVPTPFGPWWRMDGLPESLADTSTADALRAVYDLDLSGLEVDPPRGFGRD